METQNNLPLSHKLGSRLFELKHSLDPFLPVEGDNQPVGYILFDSDNAGALYIDNVLVADPFWCDASNSVGWVSSRAHFCEGHVSFTEDCNQLVGMLTTVNGDRLVVTGSDKLPSSGRKGGDAPPAYSPFVSGTPAGMDFVGASASTFAAPPMMMMMAADVSAPAPTEGSTMVDVTVYKTLRRPKGSQDEDDYVPWFNLAYGTEINDALAVVCYVNDVDISDGTTVESGEKTVLVKNRGNPEDKKLDYTFRITLNSAVEDKDRTFIGTLTDKGKEYEWKGEYILDQKRSRQSTKGPEFGPDGKSTLQQLLSISPLSAAGKDIAQAEADRIFGRIILQSVPSDVKEKLYPDLPGLDPEEEAVKKLAPDFLERAGIVNILAHLQASKDVSGAQRARINKEKCDAYFPACAAAEKPIGKQKDPVETFGWDRERDKVIVEKVQGQYRDIALKCYHLGYIRAVHSFQPFVKDAENAKFWYTKLATYLEDPKHLTEFALKVKANSNRLEADVHVWVTKLTLLQEAAGDIGDAPTIASVTKALQGVAALANLDEVEWNDQFVAHLKEFFETLDEYNKDPTKKHDEDYAKLQQLLAERQIATFSELGKTIIKVIEEYTKFMHRKPTVTELSSVLAEKEATESLKGWPKAWAKIKSCIRPAIIAVGFFFLSNTLMQGAQGQKLSISEQVSIYAAMLDGVLHAPKMVLLPLQAVALATKYMAKGVGWALEKIIPGRALGLINAAKSFGAKIESAAGYVKGLWKTFASGIKLVFGFFVSVVVLWAAAEEFKDVMKKGRTVDKWFAGTQLVIAALGTITLAVQIGAGVIGEVAAGVAAIAGTLGMVLAGIGIVVAIVALIVTLALREDPVKDIVDKYGAKYGLLK